jgi:hypothetical protein
MFSKVIAVKYLWSTLGQFVTDLEARSVVDKDNRKSVIENFYLCNTLGCRIYKEKSI